MEKLDLFKDFVKKNPSLVKFVKEEKMTWQKFFELYDLYGENHEVWNDYIKVANVTTKETSNLNFSDVVGWFKNMDLDVMQDGLNSVGRVLSVLQDFGSKDKTSVSKPEYKPRPLFKHFED